MPTINLTASDLAEWRYRHSARKPGGSGSTSDPDTQQPPTTVTGGTKAYWWDFEKGERREVTTGSPPFEEIRYVHATEAEAKAAAAIRISPTRPCWRRWMPLPGPLGRNGGVSEKPAEPVESSPIKVAKAAPVGKVAPTTSGAAWTPSPNGKRWR